MSNKGAFDWGTAFSFAGDTAKYLYDSERALKANEREYEYGITKARLDSEKIQAEQAGFQTQTNSILLIAGGVLVVILVLIR